MDGGHPRQSALKREPRKESVVHAETPPIRAPIDLFLGHVPSSGVHTAIPWYSVLYYSSLDAINILNGEKCAYTATCSRWCVVLPCSSRRACKTGKPANPFVERLSSPSLGAYVPRFAICSAAFHLACDNEPHLHIE